MSVPQYFPNKGEDAVVPLLRHRVNSLTYKKMKNLLALFLNNRKHISHNSLIQNVLHLNVLAVPYLLL